MDIKVIELNNLVKEILSEERYQHSLAVAECAGMLAARFGLDTHKAELAGLGHDITKEFSAAEQKDYALLHSVYLPDGDDFPQILHGRTAAFFIKEKLNFYDNEVDGAMYKHTTCSEEMNELDKIIFIADGITPRHHLFTAKQQQMLEEFELNRLFYEALKNKINYCLLTGKIIYGAALEWYNKLAVIYKGE
ncbi:MAG: bis(5'-nucleosyl)-tetraphosphatase (symmetrical) YqeK [Spirochaetaceae bacterium]|nr:bis(5'-nucleosyl)-tetraphosphatase (symmetrical) YqeK [Spirochaetaceae bacterium]